MLWLSIALFAAIIAVPGIPGLVEIFRPRDEETLHIPESYARDPRFFGTSFRRMIRPFIEEAEGRYPYRAELKLRDVEEAEIDDRIELPPDTRKRGILVAREATIGARSQIRDCYGFERVTIGAHVVARTVACDGDVEIGAGTRILRWIDVEGNVHVGEDVRLGQSTSASGRLLLCAGVQFERAWGCPVEADDARHESSPTFPKTKYTVVIEADKPHEQDIISHGSVLIKNGARVHGSIKAHGTLHVEPHAEVDGNLIARGSIVLGDSARVTGHIFSEGEIVFGPHTRVGAEDAFKSAYAAETIRFMHRATLHGWAIAERGAKIG